MRLQTCANQLVLTLSKFQKQWVKMAELVPNFYTLAQGMVDPVFLKILENLLKLVEKIKKLIGGNFKNKIIGILGLSFKPNTDDVRDSASIEMIKAIEKEGGVVNAFDPVSSDSMKRIFPDIRYKNSWEEACNHADGVVIMTEWNEFRGISLSNLKSIMKTPILLDTRNIIPLEKLKENGFHFDNVGRI